MSYTHGNRAFLQAMIARPYLDIQGGKEVVAAIKTAQKDGDEAVQPETIQVGEVMQYIGKAQDAVAQYDMNIRDMEDQQTGQRVWVLVNAASDEVIKMATQLSADEIAFFKRLLDAMFDVLNTKECEVMAISGMQALSYNKNTQSQQTQQTQANAEPTQLPPGTQKTGLGAGLGKKEAEEAVNKFVDLGWFDCVELPDKKFYFLTTRAILELELYLMETYNVPEEVEEGEDPGPSVTRIKQCDACKYIITMGYRCSNLNCAFRIHKKCLDEQFRNTEPKCNICKTPIDKKHHVGWKAAPKEDSRMPKTGRMSDIHRLKETQGTPRVNGTPSTSRTSTQRARPRSSTTKHADKDNESAEEPVTTTSRNSRKRQSSPHESQSKRARSLSSESAEEPSANGEANESDDEDEQPRPKRSNGNITNSKKTAFRKTSGNRRMVVDEAEDEEEDEEEGEEEEEVDEDEDEEEAEEVENEDGDEDDEDEESEE